MGLADGDLFVSESILSYQQANRIYQNFRGASVPSALQPGALWSDSDDDKIYHRGASAVEEILQLTRSSDVSPKFDQVYLGDGVIKEAPHKTTAAWSKSIGSGGDYADWATMIAAMPDMIAHVVTVTLKTGTVLTETCELKNKHGLTKDATIIIQAEEYFPRLSASLTATGGSANTLVDTGAFTGEDFSDCWVMIVHDASAGTATQNGWCQIDSNDNNTLTLKANWPVANAAVNDRYIIVGAIVDAEATRDYGFHIQDNSVAIEFHGIGVDDAVLFGFFVEKCVYARCRESGAFNCDQAGFVSRYNHEVMVRYNGWVKNNTDNVSPGGGVVSQSTVFATIRENGISDNLGYGVHIYRAGFALLRNNIGDNNGAWGTYCEYGGFARLAGTEHSGAGGNHSDPGTAGDDSADQAAAF